MNSVQNELVVYTFSVKNNNKFAKYHGGSDIFSECSGVFRLQTNIEKIKNSVPFVTGIKS